MINLILLGTQTYYFLNMTPGVSAASSGAMSVLSGEGLSAFHNSAAIEPLAVNATIGQWLYGTSQIVAGVDYNKNCLGILYNDYGSIQGYDRFGNKTEVFRPNDIILILGRDLGLFGISIKAFSETIAEYKAYGLAFGISAYVQAGRFSAGIKCDNIGKDLANNRILSVNSIAGIKCKIIKDVLAVNFSGAIPENSCQVGFSYNYSVVVVNLGLRYPIAKELMSTAASTWTNEDLDLGTGLVIKVDKYQIGYSMLIDQYSSAHQFSIVIKP